MAGCKVYGDETNRDGQGRARGEDSMGASWWVRGDNVH